MHKKRALVLPSSGLGDGLIFSSLCYNLAKAGFSVDCVHTKLSPLKEWVSSYKILSQEEWSSPLDAYDLIIINQEDISAFVKSQIALSQKLSTPFYLFSPSSRRDTANCHREISFLDNLSRFYENTFPGFVFEKKTGIEIPTGARALADQVVIHAAASSSTRQWPLKRYMKVYDRLKAAGYSVTFVFWECAQELALVKQLGPAYNSAVFSDLKELVSFLKNCTYFIGNDSGLGHLASSLNIPTLTIFNCSRKKIFWRPAFGVNMGIAPSRFLPNVKGLRLRQYALFLIYPWQVMRKFFQLERLKEK